jgi:hypothetical protein
LFLETAELRRTADLFGQKVRDIYRPMLATQHAVRNALACDGLALVGGAVLLVVEFGARFAVVEVAHEGFFLVNPNCGPRLAHDPDTEIVATSTGDIH